MLKRISLITFLRVVRLPLPYLWQCYMAPSVQLRIIGKIETESDDTNIKRSSPDYWYA